MPPGCTRSFLCTDMAKFVDVYALGSICTVPVTYTPVKSLDTLSYSTDVNCGSKLLTGSVFNC